MGLLEDTPPVDCCQWSACYDPVYHMCVDTCPPERKCQTEEKRSFGSSLSGNPEKQTQWVPCPAFLNVPDCTGGDTSAALPMECYPDIPQMLPILNMRRHLSRVSIMNLILKLKRTFIKICHTRYALICNNML